ncbi:MAG: bifunctional fucokinase/L-fucose-1-P-guanylyltransferase [Muribaculaceae bacterium]|nr:bifunctional fucokinase/L-fucose-1-P-guanylyltransferase [Muribaculaceae bacterium]
MKKLLSLPPNLVGAFHKVTGLPDDEYFCTNDPVGQRLGSGGGTTWLLEECHKAWGGDKKFMDWLGCEKRILLHAGGQSRRLPSYAPSGKILTPIPIFRWERGQRLSQSLLDLQLPLYERIVEKMPEGMNTMVVSGDVYIRAAEEIPPIPDADVVCYGLWLDASVAKNHGVFYSSHDTPSVLEKMLQKPSVEELNDLSQTGYFLTDIGVWLLSDRAVELLRKKSKHGDEFREYDLYSEFGRALGTNPEMPDEELSSLSVAIVPLPDGEFYHFGTSREMISSMLKIQNIVNDQRRIMHRDRKPHPSIFVQNAITKRPFTSANTNVWVENSFICENWQLTADNIVTGVPENDWAITLKPGQCLDIVPVREEDYVVRVYNIDDKFAGAEQQTPRFPVVRNIAEMGKVVKAMLDGDFISDGYELMSAEHISDVANLERLVAQRRLFRRDNWIGLAKNHQHSVFYQLDLYDAAHSFAVDQIELPERLAPSAPLMTRIHDAMFHAEVLRQSGGDFKEAEAEAFSLLREGLTGTLLDRKQLPKRAVCADQIVWSRSPVRIDIAGGWTDTPPFCLMEGGNVINLAIELNGQPPLQAYIRPCVEPHIICRSIDLGASERIETYEQLFDFNKVGSPFSIPKAALALAGFHPRFCPVTYPSLKAQLLEFGGGLEITLFSAIPAGSGLGTSSILAATVLGAISDFCSLAWDKNEICRRTLVLEQLLTTGGGWQDQFGGVLGGVKLLQTVKGFDQTPNVRWLPDTLFTDPEYAQCHLLYYTGITRTAKDILAEIVRRMFLNHGEQIRMLRGMKVHTMEMYDAIQRQDFNRMGHLVRKTWAQNIALDHGTNPPEVEAITRLVDDLCLGYKLPGAGGGGYMYMIAKDAEAAARIKHILQSSALNPNARLVDMALSKTGLHVTRS